MEPEKHTIAVLVENKFGVLSRVAGLFSARGYNIESLSVGETLDPSVSRMTLVVRGDAFVIEQVIKQLHKLIDVIKVTDLSRRGSRGARDAAAEGERRAGNRAEILRVGDIFRAKVVDVTPTTYTLEVDGGGVEDRGHHRAAAALRRPRDRPHRQGGHRPRAQDAAAEGGGEDGKATRSRRDAPSEDPKVVGFAD